MKLLLTRTDRLGDTILASPVWRSLGKAHRDMEIHLVAAEPYLPLLSSDPALKRAYALPAGDDRGIDELAAELSSQGFDAMVALYVDRDVARLVRRTKVPLKAGPLSKVRTWFLFNRPVRQRRSRSVEHEADYNRQLVETAGFACPPVSPRITLAPETSREREGFLRELLGEGTDAPPVVIHPGMGGSARNWPAERYLELARAILEEREGQVVVTGTDGDGEFLGPLMEFRHPRLVSTVGRLGLFDLALLISRAALFIGPSTGPMHLATALETPVVTIFSPLKVQHPRRWGPYLSRGTVLYPTVECPERHRCSGRRCDYFDCMEMITPEEAFQAVSEYLHSS